MKNIRCQMQMKYSKVNPSRGYLQVELNIESQKFCVINTCKGLCQYIQMPLGIKPALGIFQKLIENQLNDIPMKVVKIDDILVSGSDDTEHLQNRKKSFQSIGKYGGHSKSIKMLVFQGEVEYNGFIVNSFGVLKKSHKEKNYRETRFDKASLKLMEKIES